MNSTNVEAAPTLLAIWAASLLHAAEQAERAGRAVAAPRWRVFSLLNWTNR
jgi:hypothetical protein